MKKLNKKGFTLIELLAVIVILAILVAVAVPAVSRYLATARDGAFKDNAQIAISAVRNDYLINGPAEGGYNLTTINGLLEKQLNKSPYGDAYTAAVVTITGTDTKTFHICITDGSHRLDADENAIESSTITTGTGLTCPVA